MSNEPVWYFARFKGNKCETFLFLDAMVFAAMKQRGGTDWRPGKHTVAITDPAGVFLRLCLFVINADFYWRAQRIRWSMQSSVNHKLKGKLKIWRLRTL